MGGPKGTLVRGLDIFRGPAINVSTVLSDRCWCFPTEGLWPKLFERRGKTSIDSAISRR